MTAVELTHSVMVFEDFVNDRGSEEIIRCYFTPMHRMPNEKVWAFYNDEGVRVAWGGMRDIQPGMRGYRLGVFKAHERQGWRLKIRDWLVAKAFEDPTISVVRTSCQVSNPPQVVRMLNAHIAGTWMEFKYATLEPKPTLWFHLTRERWEALQA